MRLADDGRLNPLVPALPEWLVPVTILVLLLALAYVGMWLGWRRRGRKHDLPALVPSPDVGDLPSAKLEAGGRYFGTTVSGDWLDRVVAQGLGPRSMVRLRLSSEGIDVIRVGGSFRIPAEAVGGARHDQGIAGKVVPPHGLLVVTWRHGDLLLDSGFRLDPPADQDTGRQEPGVTGLHNQWIRSISKMARDNKEHTA
jgi:hypothetical protein